MIAKGCIAPDIALCAVMVIRFSSCPELYVTCKHCPESPFKTKNSAIADKLLYTFGMADLLKHAPPHMCCHAKCSCSVLKCVGIINTGEPSKLGSTGILLSCNERHGWPQDTPLSPTCYHVKVDSSATKALHINRRESPKLGSAGIPPPSGKLTP